MAKLGGWSGTKTSPCVPFWLLKPVNYYIFQKLKILNPTSFPWVLETVCVFVSPLHLLQNQWIWANLLTPLKKNLMSRQMQKKKNQTWNRSSSVHVWAVISTEFSKNYFKELLQACVLSCFSRVQRWDSMDCPCQAPLDSPGKNTGVGCHSLLQVNLHNPGIKPLSPALQADSLLLSHRGSPKS